jgi:hypothetical protein
MTLRIIDNKKIDLTETEFKMYQEIAESYNTPRLKGTDLFKDLFEVDKDGIIIFLRPPNKTHCSLEVYLFLASVMQHQHLRISATQVDSMVAELKEAKKQFEETRAKYDAMIAELENKSPAKLKRAFSRI